MVAPVAPAAARVEDAADYRQRPCVDDPAETADAAFELRETCVDVAMHGDHGVGQKMDGDLAAVEFVGNRIDQERHVVVDDLRDGVAAVEAVIGLGRV